MKTLLGVSRDLKQMSILKVIVFKKQICGRKNEQVENQILENAQSGAQMKFLPVFILA